MLIINAYFFSTAYFVVPVKFCSLSLTIPEKIKKMLKAWSRIKIFCIIQTLSSKKKCIFFTEPKTEFSLVIVRAKEAAAACEL